MKRIWSMALLAPVAVLAAQESHVHGIASLDVVAEGPGVSMVFRSPADNLVGFEHQPRSEEQQHHVEEAVAFLEQGANIRVYNEAAECSRVEAHVSSPFGGEHSHEGHEDEHEEEHGDEHHDEGAHEEHEAQTHSEFAAEWTFDCQGKAATRIVVDLFSRFPGIEHLDVRSIGPRGQTAVELSAEVTEFTP